MPIKKHQLLITIDGVKDLIASERAFRCRYERVGVTDDGKPRYQCVYLCEGEPESVLVSTRFGPHGPEARLFNIWPGLFKHHREFGDGRPLCFDRDYDITFDADGRGDDLPERRKP
ncbi:hypothetical protein [Litoreibacter roseus]|uniref:Uncharacterized protein n=1 Tax=Litoreibacter roseus TaxID=2601869 RepID=A0A6N6JMW4_9RHOB|nr:hypothetical protein [Litoreibacter roseus]GFE67280.1 hypothetical protein KIN_43540 [Litoreibacter roseus]